VQLSLFCPHVETLFSVVTNSTIRGAVRGTSTRTSVGTAISIYAAGDSMHIERNRHSLCERRSITKLTPWNWVLLEKPTLAQPLKKFPKFDGTRKFITVFTRSHDRSLTRARWLFRIKSRPTNSTKNYFEQPTRSGFISTLLSHLDWRCLSTRYRAKYLDLRHK
jgi:hypothetical protein